MKSESRAETNRSTQRRNVEAQIQGRRGSQKAELHAKAAADGRQTETWPEKTGSGIQDGWHRAA